MYDKYSIYIDQYIYICIYVYMNINMIHIYIICIGWKSPLQVHTCPTLESMENPKGLGSPCHAGVEQDFPHINGLV